MLRRSASIKLFDAFGVRVGADPSFFVGLFLLILILSPQFRRTLHSSDAAAYLTTVISALSARFAPVSTRLRLLVRRFGSGTNASTGLR